MRNRTIFLTTFLALLLLNSYTFGETINVPDDFETIQGAIDESENGDTILVRIGEYPTRANFNGKNVIVASHFIIDGDENLITQTILNGGNHDGSIIVFRTGETALLIGFTLRGANTDFGSSFAYIADGQGSLFVIENTNMNLSIFIRSL